MPFYLVRVALIPHATYHSLRHAAYAAGNCLVFAEYTVASLSPSSPASTSVFSPVRIVAFLCLTGVLLLHGLHIPSGLRLQNLLGVFKIGILFIVIIAGFLALGGNLQEGVERPGNFDSWEKIWEGSKSGRNVLCACLYNVCSQHTETSRLLIW